MVVTVIGLFLSLCSPTVTQVPHLEIIHSTILNKQIKGKRLSNIYKAVMENMKNFHTKGCIINV